MTQAHQQTCPIAGSLNQLGDMWTLLIVREAMAGATRFKDFRDGTGIAKNLLSSRLKQMVEHGILEKFDAGEHGVRNEYRLTAKGWALAPIMIAVSQWGNQWVYGEGKEPVLLFDRKTGKPVAPLKPENSEGEEMNWLAVGMKAGPGADETMRRRLAPNRDPKSRSKSPTKKQE